MVEIKEMDDSYILDRCPLGTPLDPLHLSQDEYPGYGERAKEIRRRFFREVRDRYGNCVLFAWDDGKIVGFLIFLPKPVARKLGLKPMPDPDDERAEKTLVYVCMQLVSEYREKGLGTRLMEAMVAWAKHNGWTRIEANNISEGSTDEDWRWSWGLPKWERMGFRVIRDRPWISVVLDTSNSGSIEDKNVSRSCF
jgi:GNAT superfamily N-acetyltransferase